MKKPVGAGLGACVLWGHNPVVMRGTGEHVGRSFYICSDCGRTLGEVVPISPASDGPPVGDGPEALPANR